MELNKFIHLLMWLYFTEGSRGEINILLHGTDISALSDNSTVRIIEGEDLLLECVYDTLDGHVAWRREDAVISSNNMLKLSRTRIEDEGLYSCILTSTDNITNEITVDQKSVDIHILYPPSYPMVDVPKSVLQGEEVSFTCLVEARPEPTYQWRRDLETGILLSRNKTYYLTVPTASFVTYCNIRNLMTPTLGEPRVGYVRRKIFINVHRKASITSIYPGRYVYKSVGEDLHLKCYVAGSPTPEVWWSKTGDENFFLLGGRFSSYNIQTGSAGEYVCHSVNTVVAVNQTALTVHTTEVIHVIVSGNGNSNSQPELQCSDCLKNCHTEADNVSETTSAPQKSTSHSNARTLTDVPSQESSTEGVNCSKEHMLENRKSPNNEEMLTGLTVAAGTGWLVSVIMIVVNIYNHIHKKANTKNRDACGSRQVAENQSQSPGQNTELESAYVSNVRLTDNTYTYLTTYDQINSGSGSFTSGHTWRDTDSVSTQTSIVTYIEPSNTFAQF